MSIYFDHAASTKVYEVVAKKMHDSYKENYGNASSLHRMGMNAEDAIFDAKNLIASVLKVDEKDIYITSGGTESNNMAVMGIAKAYHRSGKHIVTSAFEHPAVLNVCKALEEEGFEVTYIQPNEAGIITIDEVEKNIREDTILVSIMHVNNEIGTIQDIEGIGKCIKRKNVNTMFHVDGVQGFLKFPVDLKKAKVDAYSISGHKVHGPKGVGVLYKRKNVKMKALFFGGSQEANMRPGTYNTQGVVGLYEAIKIEKNEIEEHYKKVYDLKKIFIAKMEEKLPKWTINSLISNGEIQKEVASPYIISCRNPGIKGEVVLHALEDKGIYVSTGSACSSKKLNVSHVLTAIGLSDIESDKTIRISLDASSTKEEIETLVNELVTIDQMFGRFIKK